MTAVGFEIWGIEGQIGGVKTLYLSDFDENSVWSLYLYDSYSFFQLSVIFINNF